MQPTARQAKRSSILKNDQNKAQLWRTIIHGCLAVLCSYFFAEYLGWDYRAAVQIVAFGVLFFILNRKLWTLSTRTQKVAMMVFAAVFSLFFVLGHHVHFGENTYSGSVYENYIESYSVMDIVAFIFDTISTYLVCSSILSFLINRKEKVLSFPNMATIPRRQVFVCTVVLFLLWLPYLLIYWPGFIFGDTLSSLNQALGNQQWTNHHPAAYTAYITLCIKISNALGHGVGGAVAICSISQMCLMGVALSYISNWIIVRGRLALPFLIVLIATFGCLAYFATYSIAMWKDPLFSCAVALLSLRLFDYVWRDYEIKVSWVVSTCVFVLLASLLRNNGIVIAFALCVAFFVLALMKRFHAKALLVSAISLCVTTGFILIILGPFYSMLGVQPSPKVESLGVPLNQMARVAALDGEMSQKDADYMESLLEGGNYAEVYSPACADPLKWNGNFHLNGSNVDFVSSWLSMLLKNPRVYFEAWELQTCGWWAVNCPRIHIFDNIGSGVPRNISTDQEGFQTLFPIDGWFIPISWINWLLIFLIICLLVTNGKGEILGLIPSVGIMLTYVIASPIWYWPRYGLAEQLLLPVFILLFWNLSGKSSIRQCESGQKDSDAKFA